MIYQFKVQLIGFKPPIWRRLQVESSMTFYEFHKVLQIAFQWSDAHLHGFTVTRSGGRRIDPVEVGEEDEFMPSWREILDEKEIELSDFFITEKDRAIYTYDYGDNWEHSVVLEKVLQPENGVTYPICIKAMREAPEEDSRGEYLDGDSPDLTMSSKELLELINEDLPDYQNHESLWELFNEIEEKEDDELEVDFDGTLLLKTAKEFNNMEPWTYFESDGLTIVEDPTLEDRLYCSIMGEAGEVFGMVVYIGDEGLDSYFASLTGRDGFDTMLKQRAVLVSFEDRQDLEPMDYHLIKQTNVTFRGRKQWPQFRNFLPGFYPWQIDEKDANLLIVAMEQIMELMREREDTDTHAFELEDDHLLARTGMKTEEDEVLWKTELVQKDLILMDEEKDDDDEEDIPLFVSELEVKRVSKYEFDNSKVEFDCFYVNMLIQEEEGQRPYFPLMAVAVDAETGMAIFQDLVQGGDLPNVTQQSFINFVQQRGVVPGDVYVRSSIFDILTPITMRIPGSYTDSPVLPLIDELKMGLNHFLGQ